MKIFTANATLACNQRRRRRTFKCVIMRNWIKVKMRHKVKAVKHEKLLMRLGKERKKHAIISRFLSPCLFPFLCCLTDCWFLFHLFSSPIIISSFLSLLVVIHYLTLSLSEVFYSSKAGEMVWKEINDVFYRQHHLKSLNSPTFSKSTLIFNYFLHPTLSILPFTTIIFCEYFKGSTGHE